MYPGEAVAQFAGKRILVLGDLILDEYIWGQAERISPEAPVPIVEVASRTYRLGGAANVAANVAALGGVAALAGMVGEDAAGSELLRQLETSGIDAECVLARSDHPTTVKTRVMARSQQVLRLDRESRAPVSGTSKERLIASAVSELSQSDACVISDYGKGVVTQEVTEHVIAEAHSRRLPIIVDPKGVDYRKYRGAALVKPNLQEMSRFLNCRVTSDDELIAGAKKMAELLPGTAILITRGAGGMLLFRDGSATPFVTHSQTVFDVTGAGDTVAAVLGLALAAALPLCESIALANCAGGVAVTKTGTAQVSAAQLLAALSQSSYET